MTTQRATFKRHYLTDDVAHYLEQLITSGELADGQQLPPEPQLASHYGVSRTVIREALNRLKQKGLLVARAGHGTFVARPTAEVLSDLIDLMAKVERCSVCELLETRRAIEVAVASGAANRCTPQALAALAVHLEGMEAAQAESDADAFVAADNAFHIALASASRNKLLLLFERAMLQLLVEIRPEVVAVYPEAIAEHRAILDAVRARDAAGARAVMARHIAGVAARLLGDSAELQSHAETNT